jgi:hypothetical protein
MAVLSDQDREKAHHGLMRYWSELLDDSGAPAVLVKAAIRDAVNETDNWIDTNEGSFNTALPTPFKNNATQEQKTILFCAIAAMRVSPEFARKLFGGIL